MKRSKAGSGEHSKRCKHDEQDNSEEELTIILDDCFVGMNESISSGFIQKIRTHPRRIKLVLLGDAKVGKSTFTSRFQSKVTRNLQLNEQYYATITTINFLMPFVSLDIWELCSYDQQCEINAFVVRNYITSDDCPFLKDADCCMIMFNTLSRMTYKSILLWYSYAQGSLEKRGLTPSNRIVLCGMLVDEIDRKVKPKHTMFHRKKNIFYFDVSSIVNYNLLQSVGHLINKVLEMNVKVEPQIELEHFENSTATTEKFQVIKGWENEFKLYDIVATNDE